jgi:aspartate aminotransferase
VDVSIYQRRRDMLCRGLSEIGYEFQVPEGAFYLFPKSPIADDVTFTQILKEELILAVPGAGFDGPGYFRLSYAVPESTITGSMEGFKQALKKAQ